MTPPPTTAAAIGTAVAGAMAADEELPDAAEDPDAAAAEPEEEPVAAAEEADPETAEPADEAAEAREDASEDAAEVTLPNWEDRLAFAAPSSHNLALATPHLKSFTS